MTAGPSRPPMAPTSQVGAISASGAAAPKLPPNYHPVTNPYGMMPPGVAAVARQDSGGSLKSSKSFGDIVHEVKKESEAMAQLKAKHSSVTPPPRASNFKGQQGLEDWVPWPDLDESGKAVPAAAAAAPEPDPMSALKTDGQRAVCAQVREMGFPLSRAVKACLALGDDSQKIINFCLLVDRFAGELGGGADAEKEAEHALLLKGGTLDEEAAAKHLRAFASLRSLGFEASAVHAALEECGGDHDKALEKLLK